MSLISLVVDWIIRKAEVAISSHSTMSGSRLLPIIYESTELSRKLSVMLVDFTWITIIQRRQSLSSSFYAFTLLLRNFVFFFVFSIFRVLLERAPNIRSINSLYTKNVIYCIECTLSVVACSAVNACRRKWFWFLLIYNLKSFCSVKCQLLVGHF